MKEPNLATALAVYIPVFAALTFTAWLAGHFVAGVVVSAIGLPLMVRLCMKGETWDSH